MLPFASVRAEGFVPVLPRYLSDPSASIFLQFSRLLFCYSSELSGIPLSFTVEGVIPQGRILDGGSVYVNVLVTFCVLKIVPGTYLPAKDGLCMNIFQCVVDGSENYTGRFRIVDVQQPCRIIGTLLSVLEF